MRGDGDGDGDDGANFFGLDCAGELRAELLGLILLLRCFFRTVLPLLCKPAPSDEDGAMRAALSGEATFRPSLPGDE